MIALSLIPASMLAIKRIEAEGNSRTVTLLMDGQALEEQANILNTTTLEVAERYRKLGLNGIALYEDAVKDLVSRGEAAVLLGDEALQIALTRGLNLEEFNISANSTLITELKEGALDFMLAKYHTVPKQVNFNGQEWYVFQGDLRNYPTGFSQEALKSWQQLNWDIAYRPRNVPNMANVGQDFPTEANYLIHEGIDIAGNPNALDDTINASQSYLTALIESTEQDGIEQILGNVPAVRLFSISEEWLNTLEPEVVVDKFLLAANERGAKLLYLRPYTKEHVGDMFTNTEKLVSGVKEALERDGFTIEEIKPLEYDTDPLLRYLSAVGVVAGLLLLIMMYPVNWGIIIALSLLGLSVFAGKGLNWDALALMAALTFPVLGYGLLPQRFYSFFMATLISIVGALFLVAVGSDRSSMLAAEPFAGVAATLIVPPFLFLLHYALRYRSVAGYVIDFWNYRIRLGDVIIVVGGCIALVLVFFRRGNFPIIGASGLELTLRNLLSDYFVRPRFKELLGHPLGVLGLLNKDWSIWVQGVLLTGGVVAQATILNSFSHYHTPLLISLQRTLIALVFGVVLGLIFLPLGRLGVYLVKRWLATANT